jgi:hypothetical protein
MSKQLKFTVNTTYNRQDVGPDYFDGAVEVEDAWAKIFIEQGRAEEVLPEPVADEQTEGGEAGDDATAPEVVEETPAEKSGLDTESADALVPKTSKKKNSV